MREIFYKSKLNVKYKSDIERIFFFNTHQERYKKKIEEAIELYGIPQISSDNNDIIFTFDKIRSFQTLYAFDDDSDNAVLLGVIIFFRDFSSNMKIIHIAIDENCSFSGEFTEESIAGRLVDEVKKISSTIRNIKTISLPYSNYKISLNTHLIFY
ncbi:MAG: hypothetical protein WCA84_08480 [Ignavibacteriaceae bacterium]